MVFLGIYKALYDYAPQGDGELQLSEGDLLYVLEKSTDDDWWKAKRRAGNEEEDEAEGLVANNYVEEAPPIARAKALYDYGRQTDEELSFSEEAILDVYDTTDPDWTLVGLNGEYGFAPANYIDMSDSAPPTPAGIPSAPALPTRRSSSELEPEPEYEPQSPVRPLVADVTGPAGVIAAEIKAKGRRHVTFDEAEEDEGPPPAKPPRPASQTSQTLSPIPAQYNSPRSPQYDSPRSPQYPPTDFPSIMRSSTGIMDDDDDEAQHERPPNSPGGFHMFHIHELVDYNGKKNKKMPIALGINVPKGTITIAPEKAKHGHQQEWTAEKMIKYSIAMKKHIYIELVKPSRTVDFHAGATETADEIMRYLGDLAAPSRLGAMQDIVAATSGGSGQKRGRMRYDFPAEGEDEVSGIAGDEIIILDDKDDEWWQVRRFKDGREGLVPKTHIEVIGQASASSSSYIGANAGRSTVEQNRLEEQRLTREATRSHRKSESRGAERKRESNSKPPATAKSKPDGSKVRIWKDRSGSYEVEAEFITLRDNKIHLHKVNGVKIAVPVAKMSIEDLEYVEKWTGASLDDDKPLSDIKRRSTLGRPAKAGISVDKKPDYDWFDFFLQCGVNPQICQTYTSAFEKDQMGAENMVDINDKLLRTLGVKEGDILRITKFLNSKYGRDVNKGGEVAPGDQNGGLFSGPGGALRNNTRKGRPAPPVETNDVIDAKAFEQKSDDAVKKSLPPDAAATPLTSAPERQPTSGFDDNAWEVKPSKLPTPVASPPPQQTSPPPAATQAPPTGALGDLSLLDAPLIPTPAPQPAPQQQQQPPAPPQITQPTGAAPSLFEQLAKAQPTGPPQHMAAPRGRPQAPQPMQSQGGLIAPPPQRAASAPQNFNQQSAFGPPPTLQPQLTGYQGQPIYTQVAPNGQSLQELQNQKMQQNFLQMQQTGFQQPNQFNHFSNGGLMPQPTGYQMPQPTGFNQFQQQQQFPQQSAPSPFADPPRGPFQPQQTGFQQNFNTSQLLPQQTGINAFLPPALIPQATGFNTQSQQPQGFGASPPPVPPIPSQPTIAPLVPQKTGPTPPVRFGVSPAAKKLTVQPTGRRANLSQATPQNPFGF